MTNDKKNDMGIKDIDSTVAIQILQNTFSIDVFSKKKEELEYMIKLLTLAITHTDIVKTDIATEEKPKPI